MVDLQIFIEFLWPLDWNDWWQWNFCGCVDEHVCGFVGLCLCVSVYGLTHVFIGLIF